MNGAATSIDVTSSATLATTLGAHFFRHEYGKLVAVMGRRFGLHQLDAIEDAAQEALATALVHWPRHGTPDKPSAWLLHVASNRLRDSLRKATRQQRLLTQHAPTTEDAHSALTGFERSVAFDESAERERSLHEALLRMLVVCCDPALPAESAQILALKTLCGFSIREIAHRLFLTDGTVYKRLARAKARLQHAGVRDAIDGSGFDDLPLAERLPNVHNILYALFTEGHLSSHTERALRQELCDEAIRLTGWLTRHPAGNVPTTHALLALMHLHAARLPARSSDDPLAVVLLAEQDRSLWNESLIQQGMLWLARSATGTQLSRFHLEAKIAAAHCLAPSFEATPWEDIAQSYALLEQVTPSPMHRLAHALAVAESQGPAAGLGLLEDYVPPAWLQGSYQWAAVLADLHGRAGHAQEARSHREAALKLAPSDAVRDSLR